MMDEDEKEGKLQIKVIVSGFCIASRERWCLGSSDITLQDPYKQRKKPNVI